MRKPTCLLLLSSLLCGCSIASPKESSTEPNPSSSDQEDTVPTSSSSIEETKEELTSFSSPNFETRKIVSKDEVTSDDLFNLGNKVSISISISDSELSSLQSDYETGFKSEIYRLADTVSISLTNFENTFTWEYSNVGIRQKGNTSREDVLKDGEINTENHYKLCFDEEFNDPERYSSTFIAKVEEKKNGESYADRSFLDLDGLDIKWNRNDDSTHIKEVYSSYIYKAGSIIAQRVGLADFSMTQKDKGKSYSFGLCTIYEPAKKQLIKKAFQSNDDYLNAPSWKEEKKGSYGVGGENYGDLYKCTWGVGEGFSNTGSPMTLSSISGKKVGVGNIWGSYIPAYERKTNTEADYDDPLIKEAFSAFDSGDYSKIEECADLEYLSKVFAINYFLGNPDDFRYNYNNYMVYFRRTDKKMILLPIDNDRVLGITKGMNFENGNTESKPYSKNTFAGEQKNPLLLNTILSSSVNQCKADYTAILQSLLASDWASGDTFNRYMGIAKATYSDTTFSPSNENMSFESYLNKKKETINKALNGSSSGDQTGDKTVYDSLYIVGNFNDWGSYPSSDLPKYKFEHLGDCSYSVNVDIAKALDDDTLQFKINGGQSDWSSIDWSFNDDLTKLKKEKAGNARLKNVKKGDRISFKINTDTLVSEVKNLGSGN